MPARSQLLNRLTIPGLVNQPLPDRIGLADQTAVLGRPRPQYDPLGIRLGRFTIRPTISEGGVYDDNLLGRRKGSGSAGLQTSGALEAVTDLGTNGVDVNLSADDIHYITGGRQFTNQSRTNYLAAVSAYQDAGGGRVLVDASAAQLNEALTSLNFPGGSVPQTYQVEQVRLGYRTTPLLLVWEPFIRFTADNYSNVAVARGSLQGNFRNRNTLGGGVVGRYQLAERRNIVVSAEGFGSSYSQINPAIGSRDFTGATFLAGIEYGPPAFYQFRALVGFEARQFANRAFKGRTVPVAEAELVVSPTRRWTLTGTLTRRIDDSADEGSGGFTYTGLRGQVDHELRHDILLQGFAQVQDASYLQDGRSETIVGGGAGATWLINRNWRLNGTYEYAHRSSNRSSPYDESVYLLRVGFGL